MLGQKIEVMLMENSEAFPAWKGNWIPLKVIGETKFFFVCEVLPHINPMNRGSKAVSGKYHITLQKWDIGRKWKIREVEI